MAAISATVLSWIKTEVDHTLSTVRDNIARFSARPEDTDPLHLCPGQLHQVSGALRIVGLSGATRFCEAIEGTFTGLNGGGLSRPEIGVVDRAVVALKDFVDDLARGQANVPLKLFPVYRELTTLQGKPEGAEKDLFFPDLTLRAPAHPSARVLGRGELGPYVQAQRARFQRGLLAWLRQQPEGLQAMHQAVDALHQVASDLPEPRALWWVAGGLIEGLLTESEPDWIRSTRALCNKLDFQMRDIASAPRAALTSGTWAVSEALLREMLYAVAKCQPSTSRIREIKLLYELDSLFPGPELPAIVEFDMDWLQPALDDVRSRLARLEGEWLLYISGETESVAHFRELVASLKSKAGELGNPPFVRLLEAIVTVSNRLPDRYPQQQQFMVIEMASAFLLAESIVEDFTSPPEDLEQQVRIMGGWLLDAAAGGSTGNPPAGLRTDLTQEMGALQLRAQVAKEILTNLQHVEQVVDAFARDPSRRETLPPLKPYLRQIHGALVILDFGLAMELTSICDFMIGECAKPDHPRVSQDLDWIAEGLSSLVYFLEPCLHGREPAHQAIALFFDRFNRLKTLAPDQPAAKSARLPAGAARAGAGAVVEEAAPGLTPTAAGEQLAQAPALSPAASVPDELLSVYLTEAVEVLAGIDAAIPVCREQPDDLTALATIRRGFHTLKGSGRMVRLTDFGEPAWEIERVLNRHLERGRPATPELIDLIATASTAFSEAVARLRAGEPLALDSRRIVALARSLRAGEEAAEPALPGVAEPGAAAEEAGAIAVAPAAEAQPEEIAIGEVRLGRSFFEIYCNEAAHHAAALEAQFNAWRGAPGTDVSREFERAAHTLASSSHTAGFMAIADLARAVEQWLPFARQLTQPADAATVRAAIAELGKMVAAVTQRHAPHTAEEVHRALHDLSARLQSAPPVPVETAPRAAAVEAPLATPAPVRAARARPVPPSGRELRTMFDDIDEQLLPVFLEEAQGLLPAIGSDLREWKANPADRKNSQSLRRALHTLKGSARMAGAIRLGELTHIMEGRVETAVEKELYPPELFEDLESKMDRLSFDVERMGLDLERARSIQAGRPLPAAAQPPAAPRLEVPRPVQAPVAPPLPAAVSTLRINADTLDQLISESGEVSIARSRVEAELRLAKQSLGDLGDSIVRLRGQLREVEVQADSQLQSRLSVPDSRNREFDPLEFDRYTRLQELTRMMAESLHDATSIHQALLRNVGETDAALAQQARISREVQQALMRMRAVPFSTLNERLYRIARQSARELDKRARLEIEGGQVELDRSVLDRVGPALEHMLRNALAHGIEPPQVRAASGKPESGRINITLRQEGNEIALVLSDDGAGLDLEMLRRRAIEKGIVRADQELTENDAMQLIFASGISTAEAVTELSGRGVGMDVVRNEVAAIGGRIDIATTRGAGTSFTLYLPLTLAVTQALMVRAAGSVFAIPAVMVEQVLRLKADAMADLYGKQTTEFQGRSYPLRYLPHLLGATGATAIQNYNSVLLLRSGIQRVALHVDELAANQEIVVKNIGPQVARVPGIAGATVLADGRIALIVNPVQLAHLARGAPGRTPAGPVPAMPAAPVVMVVDDSLTVRKITSRMLEREGYHVVTAKDGLDALEKLKDALPDMMLVDIEMPRMDGYELMKNLREDARTNGIPIVIISSRIAEKHRNQAAQLGACAFLGKPYQEAELLQAVGEHLGLRRQATLH